MPFISLPEHILGTSVRLASLLSQRGSHLQKRPSSNGRPPAASQGQLLLPAEQVSACDPFCPQQCCGKKKDATKFQGQFSCLISDFSAYNPLYCMTMTHCHSSWVTKCSEEGKGKEQRKEAQRLLASYSTLHQVSFPSSRYCPDRRLQGMFAGDCRE